MEYLSWKQMGELQAHLAGCRCCAIKLKPGGGLICGETTGVTRVDDGKVDRERGVAAVDATELCDSCTVGEVDEVKRRRFVVGGPSEVDSVLDGDGALEEVEFASERSLD
ncbi:unnamed protein product [Strongylus vulgaris]|uniref:Uncharacterized protein n=1 Tax=Strongylus vulgaris TaxID=40348 RepID=A0A3P7LQN5_STRVU|nr:unnamed protein product [Strongylus vulgaris]